MGNTKIKLVCLLVCLCFLTGCALVRMTGRVASAAGGEMVKSADEEEAKEGGTQTNSEESKPATQSTQPMTVLQVQQRLIELGYNPGPADGIMGKSTVSALKKFQQDNSLSITGRADSETVAKMR